MIPKIPIIDIYLSGKGYIITRSSFYGRLCHKFTIMEQSVFEMSECPAVYQELEFEYIQFCNEYYVTLVNVSNATEKAKSEELLIEELGIPMDVVLKVKEKAIYDFTKLNAEAEEEGKEDVEGEEREKKECEQIRQIKRSLDESNS